MSETLYRIQAETHTDDHKLNHLFDATPWFEVARPEEIFALAKCGWGGDYPADAVAQYMSHNGETPLETMFTYLTARDDGGFECHVNAGDAMTFLFKERPEVYDCIKRELGDAGGPTPVPGHPTTSKKFAEQILTHQECGCRINQSTHTCGMEVQLADQQARAVGVRIAFGIEWHDKGHTTGFMSQEWSIAAENIDEPLRSQVLALAHRAAGQQTPPDKTEVN